MLGSLARWLRLAGFDVSLEREAGDLTLAATARREGRWLLTRNRELASAAGPRALLVTGKTLAEQVREVRARLGVAGDPALFFTRCSRCNGELVELELARVVGRVPPFVAAHCERFRGCADCKRVYWRGSHVDRIAARLSELFEG
jgi:hypothetical protein